MPTRVFTSGRIRKAEYDTASRQLDLHWDNRSVLAYKQVPEEVWRRLCSAPNPATYWEDRIADEYPKGTPMASKAGRPGGAKDLGALFGGGGGASEIDSEGGSEGAGQGGGGASGEGGGDGGGD